MYISGTNFVVVAGAGGGGGDGVGDNGGSGTGRNGGLGGRINLNDRGEGQSSTSMVHYRT
jgi:hypothetical protein